MKKLSAVFCLLLSLMIVFAGCSAPEGPNMMELIDIEPYDNKWDDNGDTDIIRENICKANIENEVLNPSTENTEKNLKALKDDGSFSNVDYDGTKTDTWHPIDHLRKVHALQIAYNTPSDPYYHSEEIKAGVSKAMKYWADNDFKCDWNWWWNDIGIGMYVPDILLFGVDGMTKETEDKLLKSLKKSLIQNLGVPRGIKERKTDATGGNLTDQILSSLKIAVLENDGNTIMWIKSLLENELRAFPSFDSEKYYDRSDAEGIKADMSFQQHDQLIYFGGYGDVFLSGINQYIQFTNNTQYALSLRALNVYTDFILDGIQFATRNGYRDVNSSGRGIVRVNGGKGIFENIKKSAEILAECSGIERSAEIKSLIVNRFTDVDMGANGYRYFYESDTGMYNGMKYMASVRHASPRTRIYEELNGENPLGYYTGFGATFYYVDGDEYYNALPLFNWNKIPGTTTRQGHLPIMGEIMCYGLYNITGVTGGVSNGSVGMSFAKLSNDKVKASKAYFMFDDGVVCLGSGIHSKTFDKITTNINQTNLKGDVFVGKNGSINKLSGSALGENYFDFVYHNKISYISSHPVSLSINHVESDWKKINTRLADPHPIEGDIFCLDINHGKHPHSAKYDYTVLMNTTPEKTQTYVKDPSLVTLQNSDYIQAVYDKENDILQAVFHKNGTMKLPDGRILTVDAPCVLILQDTTLTISAHDFKTSNITVTLGSSSKLVEVTKASQEVIF